MKRLFLLYALLLLPYCAAAQSPAPNGAPVIGIPEARASINGSLIINAGLTYQLLLPAAAGHLSIQLENNNVSNSSDVCYVLYGSNITSQITAGITTTSSNIITTGPNGPVTVTAAQASDILTYGGSLGRYWPILPSEPLYITCTTTGDSISFHWQ